MTARPWYKRYGGDFVLGTMRLSLEEKGAYSLCLDLIYDRAAPIPDDARWLAGVCGVSVRKWGSLRQALIDAGKLTAVDGHLTNARAEREIAISSEMSRKHAENGSKGGNKSAEKTVGINKNNEIGQARLKPIQKPELDKIEEDDKSSLSSADDGPAKSTPPTNYPEPFEAAWKAYPHVKGRSSKPKALGFWRRLSARDRILLPAGAAKYAREGSEPRRDCGAPGMHLWLRDAKYADWLSDPEKPQAVTLTPDQQAQFERHYRETGEWREAWGERPKAA